MKGRLSIVGAIIAKDVRIYSRDRFFMLVTVVGLLAYALIFWILPASTDDQLGIGVHLPHGETLLEQTGDEGSGFTIVPFDSSEALEEAVAAGDGVVAGMDFPETFLYEVRTGAATSARIVVAGGTPQRLQPLLIGGVREIVGQFSQQDAPVALQQVVVGPDRSDQQMSVRDRIRPLLLFLVLLVEMFALASLIAAEIAQRTVTAVLVSPARASDMLAAKSVLGTALAFGQAVLLAVATVSFGANALLLLAALLLGAILITGFALIAGSTGKDFVGIVFWSMFFVIPLTIPAVATLLPGAAAAPWIQGLPTYGLVQTIFATSSYGAGWSQVAPDLLRLLLWCIAAFGLGVVVLGRRVARL